MSFSLITDGLDVSDTVVQTAESLVDDDVQELRETYPDNQFQAGLIYVAVVLDNDSISEKEVADYYGVSRADLTRAYNDIVDKM